MKYNVKAGNQTFEVEIEDINARPVVARIGDKVFEIHPAQGPVRQASKPAAPVVSPASVTTAAPLPSGSTIQNMTGNTLTAPLPGTVIEVFVKPGDKVETGQVVLIIEAMKMKNSIRSVRAGMVGQVLVSTGQSVAHKQALISFADSGEASWI